MEAASLSVAELNNLTLSMLKDLKRAKTRLINATSSKRKLYENKSPKNTKFGRKVTRLSNEMEFLTNELKDKKSSLAIVKRLMCDKYMDKMYESSDSAEIRCLHKLALSLQKPLNSFYSRTDWESLSLALKNKTTGRRFKKRNAKSSGSEFVGQALDKIKERSKLERMKADRLVKGIELEIMATEENNDRRRNVPSNPTQNGKRPPSVEQSSDEAGKVPKSLKKTFLNKIFVNNETINSDDESGANDQSIEAKDEIVAAETTDDLYLGERKQPPKGFDTVNDDFFSVDSNIKVLRPNNEYVRNRPDSGANANASSKNAPLFSRGKLKSRLYEFPNTSRRQRHQPVDKQPSAHARPPKEEGLHPSWLAKKKREEEARSVAFSGQKIKFDD